MHCLYTILYTDTAGVQLLLPDAPWPDMVNVAAWVVFDVISFVFIALQSAVSDNPTLLK